MIKLWSQSFSYCVMLRSVLTRVQQLISARSKDLKRCCRVLSSHKLRCFEKLGIENLQGRCMYSSSNVCYIYKVVIVRSNGVVVYPWKPSHAIWGEVKASYSLKTNILGVCADPHIAIYFQYPVVIVERNQMRIQIFPSLSNINRCCGFFVRERVCFLLNHARARHLLQKILGIASLWVEIFN